MRLGLWGQLRERRIVDVAGTYALAAANLFLRMRKGGG
jgi:hypothetical protein